MLRRAWVTGFFGIPLCGVLFLTTTTAAAEPIYHWRTEEGADAFTDDPKRIPARYRSEAEARPTSMLQDYDQLSTVDSTASAAYQEQLAARLERLRELNQGTATSRAPLASMHPPRAGEVSFHGQPLLRPSGGAVNPVDPDYASRVRATDAFVPTIGFTADPNDSAPVVVEKRRLRDRESWSTRHVTIVRQGDRVLGVIKPRSHVEPVAWADEEVYEGR